VTDDTTTTDTGSPLRATTELDQLCPKSAQFRIRRPVTTGQQAGHSAGPLRGVEEQRGAELLDVVLGGCR
jgi:hypothetical protein